MMTYPERVRIGSEIHDINTDYRVALECLDIIGDDSIGDIERTYAVLYKLFGFIPEEGVIKEAIDKASLFLSCGEDQKAHRGRKSDIDMNLDMKYIIASFRSDYGIDLTHTNMHWYEFTTLISGLTEHAVMSRVRQIRNYDLSEISDPKERQRMLEAKESVALPVKLTEEEEEAWDEFESLFK